MNSIKIILVVLLATLLVTQATLADEIYEFKEFKTLEGEISITGTDPILEVLLITEEANYTISGKLTNELKRLTGAKIRVTGGIDEARFPNTKNDIKAIEYKLLELDYESWVVGEIKHPKEGYVLIGEDQIIYNLEGFSESKIEEKLDSTKSILIGEVEFLNKFEAEIDIEGYKIISD